MDYDEYDGYNSREEDDQDRDNEFDEVWDDRYNYGRI